MIVRQGRVEARNNREMQMSIISRQQLGPWLGILLGAISIVCAQRMEANFDLGNLLWPLGATLLFFASLLAGMITHRRDLISAIAVFGGIIVGGIVDATYDLYANHIDQNLFGLAMIFWFIVGAIPIVAGFWVSALIRRLTQKAPVTG